MSENSPIIIESAPAKLNLRLKFTGRRHDGYHLLSMLSHCVNLADTLEFWPAKAWGGLSVTGPYATQAGPLDDNLVYRAFLLFQKFCPDLAGVRISLVKNVPVGAGLGGGSSDAAATLRGLCRLAHETGHARVDLFTLLKSEALSLGADVPFFLSGGFARVSGIGEVVHALPKSQLSGTEVLIMLPKQSINTKQFYSFVRKSEVRFCEEDSESLLLAALLAGRAGRQDELQLLDNDFEDFLPSFCPAVWEQLSAVRALKSLHVSLTGSGSAFFALPRDSRGFEQPDLDLLSELRRRYEFTVFRARIAVL